MGWGWAGGGLEGRDGAFSFKETTSSFGQHSGTSYNKEM